MLRRWGFAVGSYSFTSSAAARAAVYREAVCKGASGILCKVSEEAMLRVFSNECDPVWAV